MSNGALEGLNPNECPVEDSLPSKVRHLVTAALTCAIPSAWLRRTR